MRPEPSGGFAISGAPLFSRSARGARRLPRFRGTLAPLASLALVACATSPPTGPAPTGKASPAPATPAATTPAASPSGTPSATTGAWKDYAVAAPSAFRISLPPTWQAIDPSRLADSDALDELKRQNPAVAPIIQQSIEQMRSGSIAFLAADPASASLSEPYPDSLAVARPAAAIGADQWGRFVEQNMSALRQQLGLQQTPAPTRIEIPGTDDAVEAVYAYPLTILDGRRITAVAHLYLVRADDRAFVLTLTTTHERADSRRHLFRQIATTFAPNR